MDASLITVMFAFDAQHVVSVQGKIDEELGNPALPAVKQALDATDVIHFASVVVVPPAMPWAQAHLLVEITSDGTAQDGIAALATALESQLKTVLEEAGIYLVESLFQALVDHRLALGQAWWDTLGLPFNGTPGMTRRRIVAEARLAEQVSALAGAAPGSLSPFERLSYVRQRLWSQARFKWAFEPEPAPMLQGTTDTGLTPFVRHFFGDALPQRPFDPGPAALAGSRIAQAAVMTLAFPAAVAFIVFFSGLWYWRDIVYSIVAIVLATLLGTVVTVLELRRQENANAPVDREQDAAVVASIMRHESFAAQNLFFAVSQVRAGLVTRIGLRVALFSVGAARFFCRPGFLGANSMIHFARWLVLPGTNQLVFLSNYDGTWQGYVGDFVTNTAGAKGVTAIWSNCMGFPRSRDLFDDGAADRDRLVRWARCQQREVCFWYSGYPTITTDQVRTHAAIRQGIALAASAQDAEDWLACFGSAPRPATELQFDEIPAVAFGGLPRLPEALAVGFCLGDDPQKARLWLRCLQHRISYGEEPRRSHALVLGLSANALRCLGLPADSIATFPVAFQNGMDAPERARANGDQGAQDPAQWQWGNGVRPADVWLVLYDRRASRLVARFRQIALKAHAHGHQLVCSIALPQTMATKPGARAGHGGDGAEPIPQTYEPFGFADGISQPAIRGTRRARRPQEDVLPAGEFVLGYPDLLERMVPSPTIGIASDPENRLYTCPVDPDRQRPDFTHDVRGSRRDLGRNGTFLVVRQLEQDVAAFNQWLAQAASTLAPVAGLEPRVTMQDWLAAKIIGRWRDGTPLALHPHGPVGGVPENGFRYAEFDGTGDKCPIGAHMRRANPRDGAIAPSQEASRAVQMHRMIRVGRPYTSEVGVGTLFMCVVADIERQFEFVQQRWLLNPAFNGLQQETDPLVGRSSHGRKYSIPGPQGCVVNGLQNFVTMRGGGYYFVPSRSALSVLTAG